MTEAVLRTIRSLPTGLVVLLGCVAPELDIALALGLAWHTRASFHVRE